ncbi:FtsX-like permease family protein [Persicimonas caeni]|uniref:FtsX-like permease family protein n=1 Tax=Persicimonas caeni TaxID=2292766 RepID=A0A4Y6PXB7_PERCE|nr:FtsX-like permease family protein [Persicimonas caeni]QDG52870.1 FtsX-like permease family protein [Persicimonas caeni]QED34092.1 FtsX-like permease family protein [Persicimonas caeni]
MSNFLATFRLLVLTAARSVVNHRMKSLIVGFILMFGTALLVLGTSLLDSVERSMEKTVTQSLAGHLQIYSADAEDELALFGDVMLGGDNIGEIEDFSKVREPIEKIDNVKAVVPMGMTQARFVMGNRIDEVIAGLRDAVDNQNWEEVDPLADQLRAMAEDLKAENEARAQIASNAETYRENVERLSRVLDDTFWDEDLRENPREALFFLDTKIAPLSSDGRLVFMRVLGTDPQRFATYFDRFEIVKGEMIPPGERGLLVSNRAYEEWLKNNVARELDKLHEEIHEEERVLADDELLRNDVKRLQKQYRQVIFGLQPDKVATIKERVADYLGSESDDAKDLLTEFLALTDDNFDERYTFFYDELAPLMRMHEFEVGETITLQAFTDRGFPRSRNTKFYGTFQFEGMEDSDLSGSVNLIDMPTFRTLYGAMSEEAQQEIAEMRDEVGVEDIRRDEAEDALFGGGDSLVVEEDDEEVAQNADEIQNTDETQNTDEAGIAGQTEPTEPSEPSEPDDTIEIDRQTDSTYDPAQIDNGLARNAAILLEDSSKLQQTMADVRAVIDEHDLGLTVVDWQKAAGIVGQFVIVIRLALFVAIGIIFLVALVIINNSMVMATVERTGEIGTMRAIGAQRWYVMALFLLETLILGLAAGLAGCGLGALIVAIAGHTGIPATTDFLRFLFAGDHLYPTLSVDNVLWAFAAIVAVSTISTLYPARLATRIQPIVAMRN